MSVVPADIARPASRWQTPLLVLGALIVALLLLYRETVVLMVGIWSRSDTFAHAFLVPPIVLWLIWRRRDELALLQPVAQPSMLLPIFACGLLWLLGDLVAVNVVTQFALVAMIVLAVPLTLGFALTRAILFPLAFLFFCVPAGDFLLPILMEATADFTIAALQLSGIPVYREGLRFVIPSGHWSVVEACSGVRYLIASFMVGTLFGYLNYRSMKRRWIFAGISILVPIVANWLRAYMIVMIGHLSDNKLATGVDHIVYGWVFFGLVIMLMFLIGSRWAEPEAPPSPTAVPGGTAAVIKARPAFPVAAAALAVMLLPHGLLWAMDHRVTTAAPSALNLPEQFAGGWTAAPESTADWRPGFVGQAVTALRRYVRDGREVWLYIAYYRDQNYERKLVNSNNVLVGSNDPKWNHVRSGSQALDITGLGPVTLRTGELLATGNNPLPSGARLIVWQTYWVHDTLTTSDSWAKVQGALERLQGHGDDGALVLLYTKAGADEDAGGRLEAFANESLQPLTALLRATRERR